MFSKIKLTLAAVVALSGSAVIGGVALAATEGHHSHPMMGMRGAGMLPGLQQLNLTDAQKSQLKAIAQKYRPQAKQGNMKAEREQLKAIVLADQVDGAKLKSFLQARAAEMQAKAPQRAAMLGEMRAVLTDAQRAQLVKAMDQQQAPKAKANANWQGKRKAMGDRMLADLNLTATQKAKVDALQAKMQALRTSQPGANAKSALKAFIQTGDQAAFQASMQANRPGQLPVDEIVAVATSLDKAQREKLVAKLGRFGGFGEGHGRRGHRHHEG
jgi:Spy/CpxP family protein refolding chaperone